MVSTLAFVSPMTGHHQSSCSTGRFSFYPERCAQLQAQHQPELCEDVLIGVLEKYVEANTAKALVKFHQTGNIELFLDQNETDEKKKPKDEDDLDPTGQSDTGTDIRMQQSPETSSYSDRVFNFTLLEYIVNDYLRDVDIFTTDETENSVQLITKGRQFFVSNDYDERAGFLKDVKAYPAEQLRWASLFVKIGAEESVLGSAALQPQHKYLVRKFLDDQLGGNANPKTRLKTALSYQRFLPDDDVIVDLVVTEPSIESKRGSLMASDSTKGRVVIVCGESGSGKSYFAQHVLPRKDSRFEQVILETLDKEFKKFPEPSGWDDVKAVHDFILSTRAKLQAYQKDMHASTSSSWEDALLDAASATMSKRNEWAKNCLLNIMLSQTNQDIEEWFKKKTELTLDSAALVIDEAGASLEFVRGVVAIARDFIKDEIIGRGLAKQFAIVLVGTNLDSLNEDGGELYAGTDPSKSIVLTQRKANVEKLPDDAYRLAVERGSLSYPLSSNARILMRGILPLLKFFEAGLEGKEERVEFFTALCSDPNTMSYPLRVYSTLNGLQNVVGRTAKEELIRQCFLYMWRQGFAGAIRKYQPVLGQISPTLQAMYSGALDPRIFNYGLVTKNIAQTSTALKALACRGLAPPIDGVNTGKHFEEGVTFHIKRLFEVQNYTTTILVAKNVWPEQIKNYNRFLNVTNISDAKSHLPLERQMPYEDLQEILRGLSSGDGEAGSAVAVRIPGASQGPDIITFQKDKDTEVIWVGVIQCNALLKTIPTAREVFRTVGFSLHENDLVLVDELQKLSPNGKSRRKKPQIGENKKAEVSALYSHEAIKTLLEQLEKAGFKAELQYRAIALSKPMSYLINQKGRVRSTVLMGMNSPLVEIWPGEFFEPSIPSAHLQKYESEN